MPLSDLVGLSPEEIRGISARRTAVESGMRSNAGLFLDLLGTKSKMALDETKRQQILNPPMVKMKIGEQLYEIPREAQAEGARAKAYVDNLFKTQKISEAEHAEWMKPVPVTSIDEKGIETQYMVTQGMLQTMAQGMKSRAETRDIELGQMRETAGLEALGDQTVGDIEQIPLRTLAATIPSAIPGLVSRPPVTEGLKPEEHRKLVKDQETTAFNLIKKEAQPTEAEIDAYNERSRKLGYSSMIFHHKKVVDWGRDIDEAVEVKLPSHGGVQITPEMIYEKAKKDAVPVSDILKNIHEAQLAIKEAK